MLGSAETSSNMSYQEIIDNIKPQIEKSLDFFKGQLLEIRVGKPPVALLEEIKVDCFGSVLPLKQLGIVSVSPLRGMSIQLWDKSYVEGVIKSIEERKLGMGIRIEGNTIYLSAPSLTEDSKKNLIKILNEKKENIFQVIRRLRDKAWKDMQDGFQKKEISEDDKFRGKEKLEDLIKDYKDKIKNLVENKEKEIAG